MKSTKADVIFKGFWRVNEHFADLFNTVVFHGKEILKPEILEEMDTDVSGVIEMKDYKETLSRTRDVIKKTAYGVEFVVLGIENQQHSEFLKNISYSVVAAYIFYLVQYVISNYILGKKALKLLIPVRGWFAAKEGGSIDLKG